MTVLGKVNMLPGDLVVAARSSVKTHLYPTLEQVGIVMHSIHRVELNEVLLVLALEPFDVGAADLMTIRALLFSAQSQTYGWGRCRFFIMLPKTH